ncbi:peptide/nickel transport system permease protein [Pseudorhizobium tarimense]|uniref:Peptide/nickel transport system permease protein n=1 Tax=Pseudorhizobium tarimense TaxID=1079109 RepID=A0ABV2HBM3_9HYPH|nr:ABC transporter permease [Pseudorhizobium tarimense]MCJ8520920.1 ABC transporter permease [Pseudorhizobium tarimense]
MTDVSGHQEFPRMPLPAAQSIWQLRFDKFRSHRLATLSLAFMALLIVFCLLAWPLSLYLDIDPNKTNLLYRFQGPSSQHLLGTDDLGRDVLIRLMYGGQVSLAVGVFTTFLMSIIGIAIGVSAGFIGGRVDGFLMRVTDVLVALPLIPLLIVLGSLDLTKLGMSNDQAAAPWFIFLRIVIIISLVDWTTMARIARAGTIQMRDRDYVRAAQISGAGRLYNVFIHVLPNISTPIIVAATLTIGRVILLESTLSFLGFGIVPPTPTWGNMLTNAQQLITSAPLLAVYPGLLIFATVMAVNFIGDGVRYAFDPRAEAEGKQD